MEPSNNEESGDNDGLPLIFNTNLNGGDDDDERRQCRICLGQEDDACGPLIAPCNCKGSQQWVHRTCLDEWRATKTDHIAFSKCQECLTDYRLVYVGPSAGRREYCCYVARDIGIGCTALQCIMLLLGALIRFYFSQSNNGNIDTLAGITTRNNWSEVLLADLITGLLVVLILLGLYGSIVLCVNCCSLERTKHNLEAIADSVVEGSSQSSSSRTPLPQRSLERRNDRPTHVIGDDDDDDEEEDALAIIIDQQQTPSQPSMNRSVHAHRSDPYRSGRNRYPPTDIYYCPDCCNDCSRCCDDCCNNCCEGCHCHCDCGNGGGGDDSCGPLVVVLLMAGAVLAALGLVVGFFLSCALLRGIFARHMFRLQKKRLTQNYVVQDLSNAEQDVEFLGATELHPPLASPTECVGDIPTKGKQPAAGQATPHKDYLQKLGLMDA